ncbi:unnamed protein product [Tetraodon nigroviridis]|uniref:(spotted green pufferfish) hypothetical protein n=1 Tax=Tetraodon nigroviridis TaxID=99883 RepID=Q4S166_TETNG|nr:unnamed protein product [Tetraodon nigroviridis]
MLACAGTEAQRHLYRHQTAPEINQVKFHFRNEMRSPGVVFKGPD